MQCMRVTCRALQGGCELSDGPRGAPRSLMQPIGSASCCFQSFSSDDGSGGGRAQQSAKRLVIKAPAMEASHIIKSLVVKNYGFECNFDVM